MVNAAQNSLNNMGVIREKGDDLPTSPQKLLTQFDDWGISYILHNHKAVFTVEESQEVDAQIAGTHTRNLFLKDKKGKMFLITLPAHMPLDLKKLESVIGSGRLSFGSPERLWTYLGVRPGSVTPFAIINDSGREVMPIWEQSMMAADTINCHPLINSMTVSMNPDGWREFAKRIGRADDVRVMDLVNSTK